MDGSPVGHGEVAQADGISVLEFLVWDLDMSCGKIVLIMFLVNSGELSYHLACSFGNAVGLVPVGGAGSMSPTKVSSGSRQLLGVIRVEKTLGCWGKGAA